MIHGRSSAVSCDEQEISSGPESCSDNDSVWCGEAAPPCPRDATVLVFPLWFDLLHFSSSLAEGPRRVPTSFLAPPPAPSVLLLGPGSPRRHPSPAALTARLVLCSGAGAGSGHALRAPVSACCADVERLLSSPPTLSFQSCVSAGPPFGLTAPFQIRGCGAIKLLLWVLRLPFLSAPGVFMCHMFFLIFVGVQESGLFVRESVAAWSSALRVLLHRPPATPPTQV
ncbi:hypothetical protein NDU88_002101 [Pleurodeles waltl]|uniref:Uncharacterized protein n=1 Tax=Pleurodeles waltl TaxID=8319 RepID=A0AAV7SC98_PLEWA|nr:hypothetical protein NDU88_002101 [Pleurodeles waltl]